MALSRIWAAFIITSILVACFKWIVWRDNDIFNRMVVGKADDTNGFVMSGATLNAGISQDSFIKKMNSVSLSLNNKGINSKYLFVSDPFSDSAKILKNQNPSLITMTYSQALK